MKKRYIFLFFVTISLTVILSAQVSGQTLVEPSYINNRTLADYFDITIPGTSGKSISVYNPESGFSIYEKNADAKIYPASTVKIMTAVIAYERIEDKSVSITISESVVKNTTGLKLGLKAGDVYTAEDLIRAVLICGSNDAANQLAEYVTGGNKGKFVAMMNDKASALGCTNTNFTNVTGLHDPNMYTTASDLMKISIYAYGLGEIAEWSSVAAYSFAPVGFPEKYKLRYNRNDFISKNNRATYYYKGAYGLNSGSTSEAGNCLVTSAQKQGLTYICVIMNAASDEENKKNYAYTDAKKLLDTCFDSFIVKNVINTASLISEVPLKLSANKDHIPLFPAVSASHILPADIAEEDLTYEKVIYNEVYDAPVTKGSEFGELIVKYKGDYIIGKSKLICNENIERSPMLYMIEKIKEFVTGTFFIVTMITAVILFIIYAVISFRSRKRQYWFKTR